MAMPAFDARLVHEKASQLLVIIVRSSGSIRLPWKRHKSAFTTSPDAGCMGPSRAFTHCGVAIRWSHINGHYRLETNASRGGISARLAAFWRLDGRSHAQLKKD